MDFDLEVATAVQRIINADVSQAKSILAGERPEIQKKVREAFRTQKIRFLFPEYVEPITTE